MSDQAPLSQSKAAEKLRVAQGSSAHRWLQLSFAALIAAIGVIAAFFFGSSHEDTLGSITSQITGSNQVTVINELGVAGNAQNVRGLFGGETIKTSQNGEAVIHLFNNSELRLAKNTELILVNSEKEPIIELISGKIWIFSNTPITVKVPRGNYLVNNASASFTSQGGNLEIASFRHNIQSKVYTKNAELIREFLLPVGIKIAYPSAKLQPSLAKLRYSKFRKELAFSKASMTDWEEAHLQNDKDLLLKLEEDRFQRLYSYQGPSELSSLTDKTLDLLSFLKNNPSPTTAKKSQLLGSINSPSVNIEGSFSDADYLEALQEIRLLPVNQESTIIRHKLEDLWLKSTNDQTSTLKSITEISLTELEKLIAANKEDLITKETARLMNNWRQLESQKHNGVLLNDILSQKLVVFNLANHYPAKVTTEVLNLLDLLSDLALSQEEEKNHSLLRLEIAQTNLELTDHFIENHRYHLAKKVIEQTNERLKMEKVPEIYAIRDEIMSKKELVNMRIVFFEETGSLSEEEFHQFLEDQENSQKILNELEAMQAENLAESQKNLVVKNSEELNEEVRDNFTTAELVLVSFDFQENSTNKFIIHRGILESGEGFSGVYNLDNNALSEIEFDNGETLTGGVFLTELNSIAASFTESNSSTDNSPDSSQQQEVQIDPNLKGLLKELAIRKLTENDITISQRNIEVVSRGQVLITNAQLPGVSEPISFTLNLDTLDCTNIAPENYQIPTCSLADLPTESATAIAAKEIFDELAQDLATSFSYADLGYELGQNTFINLEQKTARFSKLQVTVDNQQFIISGQFDLEKEIFTKIAEVEGKFNSLQRVPLRNFKVDILKASTKKQQEISQKKQAESDGPISSLPQGDNLSSEDLIKKLSTIFALSNIEFTVDNFEAFPEEQKVIFQNVTLADYQTKLSGEYDSKFNNFSRVSSSSFGILNNATLEEIFLEIESLSSSNADDEADSSGN
jgi:hypothetical protein